MDDLNDLPDDDYDLSQDENDTLDNYFPEPKRKGTGKNSNGSKASKGTGWMYLAKVTALFAGFLVLYSFRSKLPFVSEYLSNKMTAIGALSVLFFISLFLVNRYFK